MGVVGPRCMVHGTFRSSVFPAHTDRREGDPNPVAQKKIVQSVGPGGDAVPESHGISVLASY